MMESKRRLHREEALSNLVSVAVLMDQFLMWLLLFLVRLPMQREMEISVL